MADTVWCVFQKLPGEQCQTLSAICGSEQAAAALVELSRREQQEMSESEGEWTFSRWSVLNEEVQQLESADQLSHVLGPMRGAIAIPSDEMRPTEEDPDAQQS